MADVKFAPVFGHPMNIAHLLTNPPPTLDFVLPGLTPGSVGTLSATPKAWEDREGNLRAAMDVVVQRVLTAYHVSRKRKAMTAGGEHESDGV